MTTAGGEYLLLQHEIGLFLEIQSLNGGMRHRSFDVGSGRKARRKFHGEAQRRGLSRINAMLFVDGREQIACLADRFGRTKQEQAPLIQAVMEDRQDFELQRRIEIDQEIATADQIHMPERRIVGYILPSEDAAFANSLGDLKAAVRASEEMAQALFRHILSDHIGVGARPGPIQRHVADIRAKQLKRGAEFQPVNHFSQADGEGVRFLSGSTPRHPYSKRLT